MKKRLILLTDTWPYDNGETFLDAESGYLSDAFASVIVFPLYSDSYVKRNVPSNFDVRTPAIHKNPKNKRALLSQGIFSTAPFWFAIKELFSDRCFTPERFRNLSTGTLIFRAAYPVLRRFDIHPSDTVYSYWGDKWSSALPFLKAASGCKCVARFHGSDLYEEVKGYIPFRKALFKALDAAFTVSKAGAEYIKERYGYTGQINVARLGVTEAPDNPAADTQCFKIISCSNAIALKRLDIIARALPLMDFKVQWTHIGDGPTLESVKALCNGADVRFLGRRGNSEVKELYASEHFDLFINVSSSEGVPVSIMEAFAQGIPVIATNVGGTAEIVDSTVGELLPASITPEKLAEIVTEMRQRDLTSYRKCAKERWASMCNSDINYKAFTLQLSKI